jgi:hypothetical protein
MAYCLEVVEVVEDYFFLFEKESASWSKKSFGRNVIYPPHAP